MIVFIIASAISNSFGKRQVDVTELYDDYQKSLATAKDIAVFWNKIKPRGDEYFHKNDNLDEVDKQIFARHGVHVLRIAKFPDRLFAMIDMVEWNLHFNFLDSTTVLALFPDPELFFLTNKSGNLSVTYYIYGQRKEGFPHFGDLHYPIQGVPNIGEFDLILFAQTLEHLYDPPLCIKNIYNELAPGGYVFTSVPMLNHLHMYPFFFYEPTPSGLAMWFRQANFEVLRIGQFGNKQSMQYLAEYNTWWPRWTRYYNKTRRPQIINDPLRPVQCWILARKPSAKNFLIKHL